MASEGVARTLSAAFARESGQDSAGLGRRAQEVQEDEVLPGQVAVFLTSRNEKRGRINPEMLPDEIQQLEPDELSSGHYRSARGLLVEGVRPLQREREDAVKGIQAGLADIQAGRFQSLEDAFADLRRELGMSEA